MARIGCALLAVVLGACAPNKGATPPETPGRTRDVAPLDPTWRLEQSWTQLRAVAIDADGRVAAVGHRLVDGDPPRAVGIVQVYGSFGELAWVREIEASWVEGVDVAALPEGGFAALMHERRDAVDESVVYRFAVDGTPRGREAFGKPERAHDLAVDASGSIALVTAAESPVHRVIPDEETLFDVAQGPDGSIAFVGTREGSQWGRVDAWIVRLQHAGARWPAPRGSFASTESFAHRDADARVAAMVRWLDPRGEDPWLPDDDAMDRAVARALLLWGPLDCAPSLGDAGPDYRSYDPGQPGEHSTFDDPCLRLALLRERVDTLTAADLDELHAQLLALLGLHGDDVQDGDELGNAILSVAFATDRGPQWARATLLDGVHSEVQRRAIELLREDASADGRLALHEFLESARCDIAADALDALQDLGDAPRLDERSPGMSAETLARRWCVLRNRKTGDGGKAFWAKLVRGSYTYAEACEGDWPTKEGESMMFDPCGERTDQREDPPSEDVGLDVDCDEQTCEIGSASYRENAPHGYDTTLAFARGRDGELYVESVTVTHWLHYER
jgi:hypothetical protein